MRIRLAIPDRHVDAGVLDAVLEAQTRAAAAQIRAGEAPDARDMLRAGVRWRPEPFADGEHFDLPSVVAARGWGDCDDLGPAMAGSLRASGDDPGARAVAYRSGPGTYHVVTQLSDGRIIDPSLEAGMRPHAGIRGATIRSMIGADRGGIAIAHDGSAWCARCDVPWPGGPAHVASLARSRSRDAALARAAVGAHYLGNAIASPLAGRAEETANQLLVGDLFDAEQAGEFAGAQAGEFFAGPLGADIGARLGRFLGAQWSRSGIGDDPRGTAERLVAQRPPVSAADLRWFATSFRQTIELTPQYKADPNGPLATPWRQAAEMLEAEASRRERASSAPQPSSRAAASAAGKGARTSTLPNGASVAWSADGRTMVVRF